MLRIAIIGCGKIADQHVHAIQRAGGAEVVALCDREVLMARQLGERFRITECHADATAMLAAVRPDAVHITTPPQGHYDLARQCLDAGCHVYLEKPFTVTAPEAEALLQHAAKVGRKVTAGHNYQFTLEMQDMRRAVAGGFLGGAPVHLESHWSYDLGDVSYVGPLVGNRNHWVRRLPGQLLHNLISHGIARLAEFLDDEIVEIIARGHQSPALQRMGGDDVLDELRVHIRDARGCTACFCFTTQIKPGLNQLRVCGPGNSLLVDLSSGSLIRHTAANDKSYLTFFRPPRRLAREYARNARRNIAAFIRGTLHQDSGMKDLIAGFHQSIRADLPPPIPYREILLTARIMDEIFAQIYPARPPASLAQP